MGTKEVFKLDDLEFLMVCQCGTPYHPTGKHGMNPIRCIKCAREIKPLKEGSANFNILLCQYCERIELLANSLEGAATEGRLQLMAENLRQLKAAGRKVQTPFDATLKLRR